MAKMFQLIKSYTADECFKAFSMDNYISMSMSSQGTYPLELMIYLTKIIEQ